MHIVTLKLPEKTISCRSLQDNITLQWDAEDISEAIKTYVLSNQIDTVRYFPLLLRVNGDHPLQILTFDFNGVSGHPNHRSLPAGAIHTLSNLPRSHPKPRLYSLISIPTIPTKYIGPFAAVVAKFDLAALSVIPILERRWGWRFEQEEVMVFISGAREWKLAFQAMSQHWSQMVWFRWLYILFSRYMWVNEWVQVNLQT